MSEDVLHVKGIDGDQRKIGYGDHDDFSSLDALKQKAIESAFADIRTKITKSDDFLSKIDQLRDQTSKQSSMLSVQLKSVVHGQLNNINTGLQQMQECRQRLGTVVDDLAIINKSMEDVVKINSDLTNLREEVYTYRQLVLARKNIDYISDVPENVERARELMSKDNLLLAHKFLLDLESSRNYLYLELYKSNITDGVVISAEDRKILNYFFQDVNRLASDIKQAVRFTMSRMIEIGPQAPEKLVSVFRIVEREEYLDKYWMNQEQERPGFKLDDRPKSYRAMFEEVLNDFILRRIEGTQIDLREENKMWLVRHLELLRINIVNDLKTIKELSTICFPPHYEILATLARMYHNLISEHLLEMTSTINGTTEIFSLLQWVTQYKGKECMGNPEIGLDVNSMPPLLSDSVLGRLTDTYMAAKDTELSVWLKRCIEQEIKDWYDQKELVITNEGFMVSYLPATFEAMISQSLDVTISMDPSSTAKLMELCIGKISDFRRLLQSELQNYCHGYFENVLTREKMRNHFTKRMVANCNNSEAFPYILSVILKKYGDPSSSQHPRISLSWRALGDQFVALVDLCCSILLREIEMDLSSHLNRLMTKEWLADQDSDNPDQPFFIVDTCLATFDDYFRNEYTHLKNSLLHIVCYRWHLRILCYYLKGIVTFSSTNIMSRSNIRFQSPEDRRRCANKMSMESDKLTGGFKSKDPFPDQEPYMFDLIKIFAEILRESDVDAIVLDLASLNRKHPSFSLAHAQSVLMMRGDFTKSEAKERAETALGDTVPSNEGIFALVSQMTTDQRKAA